MKKTLLTFAIAALAGTASAAPLLSEGFENVGNLAGKGWVRNNQSTPLGQVQNWAQGDGTVNFAAASGTANSYISAIFSNAAPGGTVSNWLLTPVISLANNNALNFDLRLLGDGFLDTVEVYLSTSGSSSSLANFTLLQSYSSSSDTGWVNNTILTSASGAGATGRLAFRYFVDNTDVNGNYVGIDNVNVSVPEPTSLALFGIAALGLFASRRKAAAKR
jgi:hypothetical protein